MSTIKKTRFRRLHIFKKNAAYYKSVTSWKSKALWREEKLKPREQTEIWRIFNLLIPLWTFFSRKRPSKKHHRTLIIFSAKKSSKTPWRFVDSLQLRWVGFSWYSTVQHAESFFSQGTVTIIPAHHPHIFFLLSVENRRETLKKRTDFPGWQSMKTTFFGHASTYFVNFRANCRLSTIH